METRPPNAAGQKPAFAGQTRAPEQKSNVAYELVTVAEGLVNPWAVAFLPGGKMLVTEKPGRLRVVTPDGKLSEPVAGLPPQDARGQGGLLDVVLDPNFATNQLIYWSYAEPQAERMNNTAVARGRFVDDATAPRVENVQVIFHQVPAHGVDDAFWQPPGMRAATARSSSRWAIDRSRPAACRRRTWTC